MNNSYIVLAIYIIAVVLVSLLILLIPLHVIGVLTTPFSFRTFGIRKVKKWYSRTDTLGNAFLWLSVLFCLLFPLIPYAKWIFLGWMIFTWLCAVSRAVRLTQVHSAGYRQGVVFFLNLTFGFGLLAGMGFLNDFRLWHAALGWVKALISGEARSLLYYLNTPNLFAYLMQAALMMIPLIILWGQFKYMRLENTFKARNIGLYVIKMLLWNILVLGAGIFGYPALYSAYGQKTEVQAATSLDNMPDDGYEKVDLDDFTESGDSSGDTQKEQTSNSGAQSSTDQAGTDQSDAPAADTGEGQ